MRQIVLDTETTGLEVDDGHRVWEIGAVELLDRQRTGRTFHHYLNPQRLIDEEAKAVTGISDDFLADKPLFGEVAVDLINFVRDAELVIHNAEFDIGFLNQELRLLDQNLGQMTDFATVLDSLELARQLHPGMRNSLDALCKRYDVDNSRRTVHGALLDAELLTDVYLYMTGGQTALTLTVARDQEKQATQLELDANVVVNVVRATDVELDHHRQRLASIADRHGHCAWLEQESSPQ